MHPPLASHKHEGCEKVIEALDACHRANSFNKFIGACNDAKKAVDDCLKEEFLIHRAENKARAAAKRAKLEKAWRDLEEPPAEFRTAETDKQQ
ncbi:uncharacterized protein BYT42DRAFT_613584 [Radiomyces spectabilis]|uniref:uncharacterized protein n=1 Tax=Radiomyces spectabilis TaxID=64574 RepID=UPI00221F9031|nr:uncharacterized protein BYT42DRAFT_613584 [Radiomyces spectabilis]KAI8379254.1 hypothetical protein BYT42DRAFT_613584 [Radiomyces spectabilis]